MYRKRIRRVHFVPSPVPVPVIFRTGALQSTREVISKVYGASPAIVFDPLPPIASITRAVRMPNRGWQKFQAMVNDDGDRISGFDDGECERQTRGVH